MKQSNNILRSGIAALIITAGLILFGSCERYSFLVETINPTDTVHFQTEIQPIFTANCVSCHSGLRNPDLRDGTSYASLTGSGYVNLPAETSRLYLQVTSGSHDSRTLPEEKQKILIWIQQGAKNN